MPKVVVFDVDGTLANIEHRRHFMVSKPKNWPAFNAAMVYDTPHEDIVWLAQTIKNGTPDAKIIVASGRGDDTRLVTQKFLSDNFVPFEQLYMRAAGDYRKDSVVKVELLDQITIDWGRPILWIDDRDQVVDAIRAQGIRVLQVAPGDF